MANACSMPRISILLCAGFLFTTGAFGEEPSPVRAMIEESSIAEQFGLFAQMYRMRLVDAGRMGGLSPETGEALAGVGARAMESARLLDDLEIALIGTLSADEVAVMRDFFRSQLGKKVKFVEGHASTLRQRAEVESHRAELQLELSRSPGRKEQFDRIDRYRLMSELSVAVTASLIYAVAVGVLATEEGGASTDAMAALDVGIAAMHDTLLRPMRNDMATILLSTYRRLSNRDLEVYVAFLSTEEARNVNAAVLAAAKEILQARQHEIAKDFTAFVRRSKS
jgi:hypothetical protein